MMASGTRRRIIKSESNHSFQRQPGLSPPSPRLKIEIDLTSDSGDSEDQEEKTLFSNHVKFKSETISCEGHFQQAQPVQDQSPAMNINPESRQPCLAGDDVQVLRPDRRGLELVGEKVKLLVDAISELRSFGLEHVVDLPELVLVGDQSAGKSSLMSALTEVQLPRDQGICTKCPANIKTLPAETWTCKVSLQQPYRYVRPGPRGVDEKSVTKKNPFPPWVKQDLIIKEFTTITEKRELEDVIKWAQIALLNHNVDHELFVPGVGERALGDFEKERETTEAKISPNLIAVEISGPGLPPLSFYDLPGVFRKASKPEDNYLAKVIENLAIEYMSRKNALIIWTLAMKTDPNNSHTGKIIQDCKAEDRCVGVLTNPDHLSTRHPEYEDVLKGTEHVLRHGYFVTKQPGDGDFSSGTDFELRRKQEEKFFDENALWSGQWSCFRERCGTRPIQEFLARELAFQILESIPTITRKIAQRTSQVEKQLDDCPEIPVTDIRNTIMMKLSAFSQDVKSVLDGTSNDAGAYFLSAWKGLSCQFRDSILEMKPRVNCHHESDNPPDVIEISDNEDGDQLIMSGPSTPLSRKRPADGFAQSPAYRQKVEDGTPARGLFRRDSSMQPPSGSRRHPLKDAGAPFESLLGKGKKFIDLAGIRENINKNQPHRLPGIVHTQTYNNLCFLSVTPWNLALDIYISQTFSMLETDLGTILHKNLKVYEQTALYRSAKKHLKEFIDGLKSEQRASLIELYHLETYMPSTVNESTMHEYESKELHALKNQRTYIRAKAFVERQMRTEKSRRNENMSDEEKLTKRKDRIAAVKDEQLGDDPFDAEIRVAAYVRAYYMTAGLRFVDSVCLQTNGKFFRKIKERIFFRLEQELGILNGRDGRDGESVCRDLMEEDDTTGKKRRALRSEKDKLDGFSRRLAALVKQIEEGDACNYEEADRRDRRAPSSGSDTEMGEAGGNGGRAELDSPSKRGVPRRAARAGRHA